LEERKEAVLTVNEEKKIKKNKKNDFPKWESDNKNPLVKILIVIGLILCIFGIMDKIFEHTIFNFFKNLTMPYLEKTYEESKKMFLTLSLLKGTTDIIEGSTVNVSMIVGMEIEIGDIIQPIYDMINILWKVSLASVVILKLETIYYEIFKVKLATILTFISLITIFPYTIYKNKVTRIFRKISKYSFFILLYIYIVLPSAIFVNSTISSYFEKEYKDGRMTITIRQNMNVVWKNTYAVSSNHFSVERIDTDGHILFRIHVGERILVGEIDSRDRWIMTEPRKAPRDRGAH